MDFSRTDALVCSPLAERAAALRADLGRTVVIGLCGAQGSGKSTLAAATRGRLEARGLTTAALSLDDLYLGRAARRRLAREVHPLLVTRGPPGTHDIALGLETLDRCAQPGALALPAFDKAADDPRPTAEWPVVETPLDVLIFEGWCVGARPQPRAALAEPVNRLERDEDPQGVWRGYVNDALAGPYQDLFGRLDLLVFLQAPGFEVVAAWREEQEQGLRASTGGGMAPGEIARFVAHYERLTRWLLAEAPSRADWTVPLAADRTPFP